MPDRAPIACPCASAPGWAATRQATPALLVAGERSGCGKTTLTLALMAALTRRGMTVQGFKTGPDFLDPTWHAVVTGRPAFNLDPWMTGMDDDKESDEKNIAPLVWQWGHAACSADVAIVEGAMGLFDGLPDLPASCADVAMKLGIPVLLVIDSRGMAATAAAVARGLASFRPGLPLLGVVCTFVSGSRHAALLRHAFEAVPDIPLLGLFPRDEALSLPSRHLGLIAAPEGLPPGLIDALAHQAEAYIDLDDLLRLSHLSCRIGGGAPVSPSVDHLPPTPFPAPPPLSLVRIAIARDEAFSFWYPEHDTLLATAGVELIPFSPLRDSGLPPNVQGLILPGGYPELHVDQLSANHSMREAVRSFGRDHPIYGECGGFLYLMDFLEAKGRRLPLCGCLPLTARLETHRSALGYREVTGPEPREDGQGNPWAGLTLRGHEFHYSRLVECPAALPPLWSCRSPSFPTEIPKPEGVMLGHVFGSYVHLSFLSHPLAASRFADVCRNVPNTARPPL